MYSFFAVLFLVFLPVVLFLVCCFIWVYSSSCLFLFVLFADISAFYFLLFVIFILFVCAFGGLHREEAAAASSDAAPEQPQEPAAAASPAAAAAPSASAVAAAAPAAAAASPAAAAAESEQTGGLSTAGMCRWSRHLKHENPDGFPTFQKVVKRISSYFDLDIFATRMNVYPDGSHWKPHHHDSHAYSSEKLQVRIALYVCVLYTLYLLCILSLNSKETYYFFFWLCCKCRLRTSP